MLSVSFSLFLDRILFFAWVYDYSIKGLHFSNSIVARNAMEVRQSQYKAMEVRESQYKCYVEDLLEVFS